MVVVVAKDEERRNERNGEKQKPTDTRHTNKRSHSTRPSRGRATPLSPSPATAVIVRLGRCAHSLLRAMACSAVKDDARRI